MIPYQKMFISFNNNTKGVTSEARVIYPTGALEFTTGIFNWGSFSSIFSFVFSVFCFVYYCLSLCLFFCWSSYCLSVD